MLWFFGADRSNRQLDVLFENLAIEEEDGAEGLVLGGGGDVLFDGEVGEELFDFIRAHFAWMAFVVKKDKAFDPVDVGFLGPNRIVFEADDVADLVKEFFLGLFHRFLIADCRFLIAGLGKRCCDVTCRAGVRQGFG